MSDEPSNYPDGGMHMAALAVILIVMSSVIGAIVFAFGRAWGFTALVVCIMAIAVLEMKRNG